jgi:hypothetical protein
LAVRRHHDQTQSGGGYVLEGSVREAGNRVRITGQLIDAAAGTHVWADRVDGSLEDVFDLQEKVASIAGVIEPALQAAETARSAGRPTGDLTAYDLYLRSCAMFLSSARQIPEALHLMEQAIARDPGYGPVLAWASVCCHRLLIDGVGFERYAKAPRQAAFLAEMERIVPWSALCALIEPFYPKPGNGRPPVGVERMLRIYFLQQ